MPLDHVLTVYSMCSARPIRGQLEAAVDMLHALNCLKAIRMEEKGTVHHFLFQWGFWWHKITAKVKSIYLQDNFMVMLLAKLVIE